MEPRTPDGYFLGDVGTCGAPWRLGYRNTRLGGWQKNEDRPRRLSGTEEVHPMTLALRPLKHPPLSVSSGRFGGPRLEGDVLKDVGSGDPMHAEVVSMSIPCPRPVRCRAGHHCDATVVGLQNCRTIRMLRTLGKMRGVCGGVCVGLGW